MKQRKLLTAVAVILVLLLSFSVLAACKDKDGNKPSTCNHEWGEWEVVKEATCTANGLKVRTCSICEEEQEETIPATGHKYVNDVCVYCGIGKNSLANLVYGTDFVSLYDVYGADVSIADVKEDAEKGGIPYIETKDRIKNDAGKWVEVESSTAKKRYLGLDFLSMAMVYNTKVPEESTVYQTEDDVYAKWWMYFIERWNALLPEIPLYSNEYYDLYNTKLSGLTGHYATNPYWGVANAIIGWQSSDGKATIGNSTDLSGKFRYAAFGGSNPGAADLDISTLTSGLGTVTTNAEGGYEWNKMVVKSHNEKINDNGTKTFTIEIFDDLKFSDGSAITVDNYLVFSLVFSSPVANEAAGKDHKAGLPYVGYKEFAAYNGTNADAASKVFKGFKKIDNYKFEVTVTDEYANYYYSIVQAGFSPEYIPMWVGAGNSIQYDAEGYPYLSDGFYAKSGDKYTVAATIKATASPTASDKTYTAYPYSGAYVVDKYDTATKTATLKKNTYFKGDVYGTKASIETIVYKKITTKTQLADFKAGNLDFIAGITGGAATDEAIQFANSTGSNAKFIHYGRAGYGKLGFRADFSPVQFTEVRQALAYCLDRKAFALEFNGGYGGTVHGPYYEGSWMYQAVKDEIELDEYTSSLDSAKEKLVTGGWIYNEKGEAYEDGVRYKLIEASDIQASDITFASVDGAVGTVPAIVTKNEDGSVKSVRPTKAGETPNAYLMPLVINWYGTADNEFTDLVIDKITKVKSLAAQAGFKVCFTIGQFNPMLDELYQAPVYGYYSGTPKYNMFNFATGFTSAVYDYSLACTINPSFYDDYSNWYVKDINDYYMLAKA